MDDVSELESSQSIGIHDSGGSRVGEVRTYVYERMRDQVSG